jgi:cytochrome c oxidase subunit 3
MLTAMTIAMLTALTVWWLLVQRLREKPWTQRGVVMSGSQETVTSSAPKVGLWVFLAMVTSLFGLFTSAYIMRMGFGHGGLEHWEPLREPGLLWANTIVLVLASAAMQSARNCVQGDEIAGVRTYFPLAGLLTVAFLGGQLLAWRALAASGAYGAANPAYSFFILLTAVHGLHLVGGLWVLTRALARIWRGSDKANIVAVGKLRLSVELCTVYWHWLLLIWLGLFALLLST